MKMAVDCPYLEGGGPDGGGPDGLGPALRLVAIFHCGDALRGRALYGIYLPITGRWAPMGFKTLFDADFWQDSRTKIANI